MDAISSYLVCNLTIQVNTVTKPDHDAGINYALGKEAKETAEKYNNSLRMITAFTNRRAALNKAKKAGQDTANLSEKIEELEDSIDNAETEKAKAVARLNKLREGGVSVDEHLLTEKAADSHVDWDSEEETKEVKEVNYYSYDQVNYGESQQAPGWDSPPPPPTTETNTDVPAQSSEVSQALVLYNFDATNSDELTVSEGEWVNLLGSQAQEDGWVTAENSQGQTGLVPASFVTETSPEEYEASLAAQPQAAPLDQGWGVEASPTPASQDLSVPSCPPPAMEADNSSEEETSEESEDDDAGPPPGLAPPPGPPPGLSTPGEISGKYK